MDEPTTLDKKLQTYKNTIGANDVHAEGVVQVDSVGAPVPTGTAASPVRVDPTGTTTQPVSGTVTVTATDLDIRNLTAATDTVVANAGTGNFNVIGTGSDNSANSTAKLPVINARANAADQLWTEGNQVPLSVSLAGNLRVIVNAALPTGTNNIGDVDVLTIAAGDNNIGNVDIVTMPTVSAQGDVASDAADGTSNPIKIGGRANLNEITAVAENDRVNAWFDLIGRQVVLIGHANPEAPVTANGSAAGLSVIAAPGASLSLYIMKGSIHNRGVEQVVSLRDGAAGTIRFTANVAADGGGTLFDFGSRGWKLTANTALVADIGAASADINITEFYIAA